MKGTTTAQAMAWTLARMCIVVVILACGARVWAEATDGGQGNVGRGKKIFTKYCIGCHGTAGRGDGYRLLGPSPADLTTPEMKIESDAELLKTIHEGKPNMPAWKARLSKKDTRDVLAYIRNLIEEK